MKEFAIRPRIVQIPTCKEFAESFQFGPRDLMITEQFIYDPYFKDLPQPGMVIFKEDFGKSEPSDEMTEAICRKIGDFEYDRVIAVGGGAIIDICKLLALEKHTPVLDLFEKKFPPVKNRKLVIVPTTCGTGSEVTNISILALISRNTKLGLADPALFADDAVLIPQLLETLPFGPFATSSIDALIHAAESFVSPKASDFTRMYSKEAMSMIIDGYKEIAAHGPEARLPLLGKFHLASTYAGIAFGNAGCGAVHAMSYPLGAQFHVAHGESNYALFTAIFQKYQELDPHGRIAELNKFMSALLDCREDVVYTELENLLTAVLVKKPLHAYGVTRENLPDFVENVMTKQGRLMANCAVPLSAENVMDIYRSLF